MTCTSLRPGHFVYVPDANKIGKLVAIKGNHALVRLQHSAVYAEEKQYPLSELGRAYLYPEMRVYHKNGVTGEIKAGRVRDFFRDEGSISYLVRFPNGEELDLDEGELETRTLRPNPDPTDALAAGYSETQFFYDRRMAVQKVLIHARQHSGGLTGLLSASIDLLPHQVAVVWRVVSDPIQRYLLADEVGMGKTIEAGAILRQALLDDRRSRVVVAAPASLVRQWVRELKDKFHLEEFGDRWRVIPYSDLASLCASDVDALALDEAHHLVSPKQGQEVLNYESLAKLAHAVPRLYLLTATPVLGDAEATLKLLHLLDSQTYSLDDLDSFRQKLDRREEYGRLLISLMPGLRGFPLTRLMKNLVTTFAGDPVVTGCEERLRQGDLSQEKIDDELRSLKRYLMETYRLHQRLIRTRRVDLQGWEMLPRKAEVRVETDLSAEDMEVLSSALEDWRDSAQRYALESENAVEDALCRRYIEVFEALGESSDRLASVLVRQGEAVAGGELITFPDDLTFLGRIQQLLAELNDPRSKYEVLMQVVSRYKRIIKNPITGAVKCVVFTTTPAVAISVSEHLRKGLGQDAVVTILTGHDPGDVEQAVKRFEDAARLTVLVADRSGEEGLNLQRADAVIHYDLPLDPARLEQRIGRVDRYGRKEVGVPQTVLLPTDEEGSPWNVWYELIARGFDLFDQSLSDVQFQLSGIKAELARRLFRVGSDGLLRSVEWVREALAAERQRLEAQYELDRLVTTDDKTAPQYDDLEAGDAPNCYEDLNRWLVETLQFARRPVSRGALDPFELDWGNTTLLAKWPWEKLFAGVLKQPHTFEREVARVKPGVRLVRPGSRLVSIMETALRREDRGSSFATWRVDERWPTEDRGEWLGFRLSYVVEFDMKKVSEALPEVIDSAAMMAITRRADGLFPPWLQSVTLDTELKAVEDPLIGEILAAPYRAADRGGADFNLGSRRDGLIRLIPSETFQKLCHEVRRHSAQLIRESSEFQSRVEEGVRRAQAEIGARREMLLYRQRQMERQTGVRDPAIDFELQVQRALMEAVTAPHIRLDAIGCFVISNQPPLQRRHR